MAVELAIKTDNYPSVFRKFIMRNAQKNLREVRAIEGILPEEQREQALHTLSFTIKMLDAWEATYALLSEMSPKMVQAGLCDEWVPYLQRGVARSQVEKDLRGQAELQLQLGILYQVQGKFESAYDSLTSSAKDFQEINAPVSRAIVLNRLASVTRRQSKHKEAKNFVDEALALLHRDDPEIANAYVVLGELAFDVRNWEEAEKYFTQALTIWEVDGDQRKMAVGLRNVGIAYIEQSKYKQAINCLEKAISILQIEKDIINCAMAQINLANVYQISKENLETSLALYREAEVTFRLFNDDFHLAMVYNNLAMTYRKLERWIEAENACMVSIRGWKQLDNIRQAVNSMDELGLALIGKGVPSHAISVFEEALEQLKRIKHKPGHNRLLELLTEHRDVAYTAKKEACS